MKNKTSLLIGIIIVFLIIICILASFTYFFATKDEEKETNDKDTTTEQEGNKGKPMLEITSPNVDALVTGRIQIDLKTNALDEVKTIVEDSEGNILLEETVELDTDDSLILTYLDRVPESNRGTLRVESLDGELFDEVNLKFEFATSENRINLTSLLPYQNVESPILVAGEMQGFFEATMNYKILNEEDEVIEEGIIMAQADNYGQFAPFSEEIDVNFGESTIVTLVLLEISAKDGAENILMEIPLRVR